MLHHCSWAHEKFSNYIGCEEIVQRALDILFSPNNNLERKCNEEIKEVEEKPFPFRGIKLCVVGKSGIII